MFGPSDDDKVMRKEKDFKFNVFVHQKWTPYLMMLTLFNSISGMNDFADEATYRLTGNVELNGQRKFRLTRCWPRARCPSCADAAGRMVGRQVQPPLRNAVKTPQLKSVDATIDLLPERRVATIENAWVATRKWRPDRSAGEGLPAARSAASASSENSWSRFPRACRKANTASC